MVVYGVIWVCFVQCLEVGYGWQCVVFIVVIGVVSGFIDGYYVSGFVFVVVVVGDGQCFVGCSVKFVGQQWMFVCYVVVVGQCFYYMVLVVGFWCVWIGDYGKDDWQWCVCYVVVFYCCCQWCFKVCVVVLVDIQCQCVVGVCGGVIVSVVVMFVVVVYLYICCC